MNPLSEEFNTPFGIPPFSSIKEEHFVPAVKEAIDEAGKSIIRITENSDPADFQNTILQLEDTGSRLDKISLILFNLNSACTTTGIQEAAREVSLLLTEFTNDITLNRKLFKRIKSVKKNSVNNHTAEERRLVDEKYRSFIKGGADLDDKDRERFRSITKELAESSLVFEENVLAETNSWTLNITDSEELAGLPPDAIEAAADCAKSREAEGWIFTLHAPSYIPFMKYSENRGLREKMFKAFARRGANGNSHDNSKLVKKIVNLRIELARLLGYKSYADMILEDRMAGSVHEVNSFLDKLYSYARPAALSDLEEVQNFATSMGFKEKIEKWDYPFYSEKLRLERLKVDDERMKPWLRLEDVERAIFKLANRLYGITFTEHREIKSYSEDVKTFEVNDTDGSLLAILMVDYFQREGKSPGAWMTVYREQSKREGSDIRPIVSLVMNFPRPTASGPSLLTHNELTTFLHEFGHGLHGMLSGCTFESLSGTNVRRDFVELPSQIMENWAYEKEWMTDWAKHYTTGEPLPGELIDSLKKSLTFNEGYYCNRQISFGLLDMAYHTLEYELNVDPATFERKAMKPTELFGDDGETNVSCAFGHLFAGGYAAGYYGYKWSEVLDADAFCKFQDEGPFEREVAEKFRKNILEKGNSEDPAVLYRNFMGRDPEPVALLKRSGFIKE